MKAQEQERTALGLGSSLVSLLPLELTGRAMSSFARCYMRSPVRHMEPSIIASLDDDAGCNDWLLELSLRAIREAVEGNLKPLQLKKGQKAGSEFYDVFPGEHYRLLAALAKTLKPNLIIEIGTFAGMSAATFLEAMPAECKLVTFDLKSWRDFDSHLDQQDFDTGRIIQHLADLSDELSFRAFSDLFERSDLLFCDAPKDRRFESVLIGHLGSLSKRPRLLVFDDIRTLNMVEIWRSIKSPKIDLTSFGHWSGTGLVDMSDGITLSRFA